MSADSIHENTANIILEVTDDEVLDDLRRAGVDIVHRFGDTVVVRQRPGEDVLRGRARVVPAAPAPDVADWERRPREGVVASLDSEALRWRLSPGYRRAREAEAAKRSVMSVVAGESSVGDLP
ncbi:MAG: hypothetical protein ACRDTE_00380 [Pseudonocardiaceae bacterium]